MTNPNRPPPSEPSDDETLAALHGLGAAQDSGEHEAEKDVSEHENAQAGDESVPSPNASGFVGMLAEQAKAGLDPIEPHPDPASAAAASGAPGGIPRRANLDEIHMAREIRPASPGRSAPIPAIRPMPAKKPPAVPGWYHIAIPIMYTLGSLLILIGLWAIGALIYMAIKRPMVSEDVGYLGLAWEPVFDSPTGGEYTTGSKLMAFAMLVCLPVSLVMGVMAGWMRRQIRGERARMAKSE